MGLVIIWHLGNTWLYAGYAQAALGNYAYSGLCKYKCLCLKFSGCSRHKGSVMKFQLRPGAWVSRAAILLLYAPLFNWAFFSVALSNMQLFSWQQSKEIAFVQFVSGLICWLCVCALEKLDIKGSQSSAFFLGKYCIAVTIGGLLAFKLAFALKLDHTLNNNLPVLPFMVAWMEAALFTAIRHILMQNQRQLVLEKNYKAAQYSALKAQLNPHFLFNTLNLLSSEIEGNPEKAVYILDELSGLLRRVLSGSSKTSVSLEKELELIRHYLALQAMRFEDNLQYHIQVANECLNVAVPSLMLQPFVENCFVHGFKDKLKSSKIVIDIQCQKQKLYISIKDNGVGFKADKHNQGQGISLVQDTLELLYGGRHKNLASVQVLSQIGKGTEVVIVLPILPGSHK